MAIANGGAGIRELQNAIVELPGVRGARVQLDLSGVGYVRVLVVPESDPRQIVRDVRALGRSRFGVDIDAARVQVVSAARPRARTRVRPRRRLTSVATERSGGRFTARVALTAGSRVVEGVGRASAAHESEPRSVVVAVLHGLRDAVEDGLELDHVDMLTVGDARLAVVTLNGAARMLIGSALVTSDEHDAIARATLHAINRTLS
ncbi:MAG: hypothetical protein ABR529_11135 [Actinomycetota bacterium]